MKDIDVLVIGRACVDYIALVDTFPQEDKKVSFNCRLIEGGGQGSTASCCISKLGGRLIFVGKVGDDDEGKICLGRLEAFNVGTEFVEVVNGGKTPVAYIFVTKSTGKRTIIYEPSLLPPVEIDNRVIDLIAQAKVILLDPQGTYLNRELKANAADDIKIVYDCERWRDGMEEMMAVADYFVPSADFFESRNDIFSGNSLLTNIFILNDMIKGQLIITNGDDGAYYLADNSLYHVLPPKVSVKDTTGAGDNFHAALALAVSRGLDLQESVKLAVAVASCSCRELGGRNGIPGIEEALDMAQTLQVKVVPAVTRKSTGS